MSEKTTSKYLINLEKNFAYDNPVLQNSAKIFHELDQIEYDLGLIDPEETTACKNSWWPIISLIGGNSTAKSRFINNYLGATQLPSGIQASNHKFTVLLHNSQTNSATLPGTALDVDPRYPFYQISRKFEQLQKGEGNRINSYLELKTINTDRLKGRLFIDSPNISATPSHPIYSLLTQHTVTTSDLVFVFTDVFESASPMLDELIQHIAIQQDSNKFVYLIDEPLAMLNPAKSNEIIASWQRKLSALGLNTGQFIIVANQQNNINPLSKVDFSEIDQRLANVAYDRTYRILDSLEKNIHDIENVVIPEVKNGIALWKERVNISSLVVLCFIAILAVFAEINFGVLEFLIDPIIGPIIVAILLAIMVPTHLLMSKFQAKLIIKKLNERQAELHLMENLANLFEQNLTVTRMLMPITEPLGWNKKMKARLIKLSEKTKELVQSLNDNFGSYNEPIFEPEQVPHKKPAHTSYLDLSKL
ncbi:MAG: hypothetical protein NTV43_04550 [Methylococcales bacterium]|nr:hypothetical protein [Methylococcales bacterium]